jgi:hypothetical protein
MDRSDDGDGIPSGVAVVIRRYWMTQIREQN